MKFFFDTANHRDISDIWDKMKPICDQSCVAGITTNPKAMAKIEAFKYVNWLDATKQLLGTLAEIRGDDKGTVFIQMPSSTMTPKEFLQFVTNVKRDIGEDATVGQLGFKVPPYPLFLREVSDMAEDCESLNLNVTGIADHCTALTCLDFPVRYVSIIPGRMSTAGIDADTSANYINVAGGNKSIDRVITGSIRDVAGLSSMIKFGTVPTIGTSMFNELIVNSTKNIKNFINMWNIKNSNPQEIKVSPTISTANQQLSRDFFTEMDSQCPALVTFLLEWIANGQNYEN
tara:strand:+ start:7413 stop:8276 length:864 start_codon:yes stop_codon:yes gene_type:complete